MTSNLLLHALRTISSAESFGTAARLTVVLEAVKQTKQLVEMLDEQESAAPLLEAMVSKLEPAISYNSVTFLRQFVAGVPKGRDAAVTEMAARIHTLEWVVSQLNGKEEEYHA